MQQLLEKKKKKTSQSQQHLYVIHAPFNTGSRSWHGLISTRGEEGHVTGA